jgi:hypothetical protein
MLHMLHTHVASVFPNCFICFSCMLHTCIQVFHVASVCFRGMFRESWGHGPDTASQGPTDGVRGAPGVLRTGRAHPRPGSQVPSTRRQRRGSWRRSGGHGAGRDGQGRGTRVWRDEADRERLHRYGGSPAHFLLGYRPMEPCPICNYK